MDSVCARVCLGRVASMVGREEGVEISPPTLHAPHPRPSVVVSQDGLFVHPADARTAAGAAPKPAKITLRRRDARGHTCQYYVVDDVSGFEKHDWCGRPAGPCQGGFGDRLYAPPAAG